MIPCQWVEPEMLNTKSELFEKHSDWIIHVKGHEIAQGRGGTQIIMDLSKPKKNQDFVYNMLNDLLIEYPRLVYMHWDANSVKVIKVLYVR